MRTDQIFLEDSIMPVFNKIETRHHATDPARVTKVANNRLPLRFTLEHSPHSIVSSRSSFKLLYFFGQLGGVIYCLIGLADFLLM